MSTDIIREIDPNFAIPDGLKNAVERSVVEDEEALTIEEADIDTILDDLSEDIDSEDADDDDELPPPEAIEIISQTVKVAPDGTQYVDIVIEIEDVDGAVDYEVRYAKE